MNTEQSKPRIELEVVKDGNGYIYGSIIQDGQTRNIFTSYGCEGIDDAEVLVDMVNKYNDDTFYDAKLLQAQVAARKACHRVRELEKNLGRLENE